MEFKKYTSNDFQNLFLCLVNVFGKKKINKKTFSWKYFDHILHQNMICYLAIDKDHVVSSYINMPLDISYDDKKYNSRLCASIATVKNYRRKGLISELAQLTYKEVKQRNCDFTIGFSNSEGVKVDKNSKNYAYQIVGKYINYGIVAKPSFKLKFKLNKTDHFNEKILNKCKINFYSINKNKNFLHWRYKKNPKHKYSIYEIIDQGNTIGYVILKFSYSTCAVYDLCVPQKYLSYMNDILKTIEHESFKKMRAIIFYNILQNNFWKNIFYKKKFFIKKPNNTNYYLTIKIHNENFSNKETLTNKDKWFLMAGGIW